MVLIILKQIIFEKSTLLQIADFVEMMHHEAQPLYFAENGGILIVSCN